MQWPWEVKATMRVASGTNFNIELAAPECSVQWTFDQKFWIVMSLPIAALVVLLPLSLPRRIGVMAYASAISITASSDVPGSKFSTPILVKR